MPGIGGENDPLFAHRQQVVGAHQPQYPLAIGHHSPVTQLRSYPAVAVAAILQHDLLDQIAQPHVGLARLVFLKVAVKTSPAHVRDLTSVAGLKALKLHHASDLTVDAVAPVFRRDSFTRLKALCITSSSNACWPILRS